MSNSDSVRRTVQDCMCKTTHYWVSNIGATDRSRRRHGRRVSSTANGNEERSAFVKRTFGEGGVGPLLRLSSPDARFRMSSVAP